MSVLYELQLINFPVNFTFIVTSTDVTDSFYGDMTSSSLAGDVTVFVS